MKTREEIQINWKIRKSKRKKEIKKFRQNYDIERKTNEEQAIYKKTVKRKKRQKRNTKR